MAVRLHLGAGGRTVELRPGAGGEAEIRKLLAELDPPVRPRRRDGFLVVDIDHGGRLLASSADVDADAHVRRAVENRSRVADRADAVRSEERLRCGLPEEAIRGLIEDSDLAITLDGHQAKNVAVMTVPDGWGTPVFDEQGTGKTVTMIVAFDLLVERGEAEVLVVVAPKSMVGEWAAEFRRFTGGRYRVTTINDGKKTVLASGADVVVLNYEAVTPLGEGLRLLARRAKTVLAVDESFFVKNPSTARSQAVAALREWCSRCFVLCGTPAPNSPHDLVAQFDLVDFGLTFEGVRLDADRDVAAAQVQHVLDTKAVYVRSLKTAVLPDLPKRTYNEVRVPLAPDQRRAYESALRDLIVDLSTTDDDEFTRTIDSYLERRQTLLRICSDPTPVVPGYDELPAKIDGLDGLLEDLVGRRHEKVVLWSFYRSALDRIARRYQAYGVARIDGSVPVHERREAVRRFQEDDETMLFVGNPAAAGAGLTLHRARFAVYESFSNQAAHFLQSLDRIHRRGQVREVEYFALLCDGTIEEDEYARLLDKSDRQASLLGDTGVNRPTRQVLLDELLGSRGRIEAIS